MAQITALPQDLRILNDQLRRVELIDTRLSKIETALGVTNSNIPSVPVQSVFGRTGVIVAVSGDYSFPLISGTVNLATQTTGNLAVSHLASGTNADSAHVWRGDGLWAAGVFGGWSIAGTLDFSNAGSGGAQARRIRGGDSADETGTLVLCNNHDFTLVWTGSQTDMYVDGIFVGTITMH